MFHQLTRLKWPENISDRRLRGILPCDLFAVNFFLKLQTSFKIFGMKYKNIACYKSKDNLYFYLQT